MRRAKGAQARQGRADGAVCAESGEQEQVMERSEWERVDNYLNGRLVEEDPVLDAVLRANQDAGLPAIDVSEAQGKFLHLMVLATGARRVLEVGTLGGYSTIWLARAVGAGGRVVTLEMDDHHADVAAANFERAGMADRIELRRGPALRTLPHLEGGPAFDLVFIDADKPNNLAYLQWAIRLSRRGAVVIVDNVVRRGGVADAASSDPSVTGTRAMLDWIAGNPALTATGMQTVGAKGWDGFVMAVVA
jgi:predicted O-methyltransferase YrrM